MATEWLVESLRLSLFSRVAVEVTEADWQVLTGQNMAASRHAIAGGYVFSGRHRESQLSLSGTGTRADIVMSTPQLSESTAPPSLPCFGRWTDVRDIFVQLTENWKVGERFPVVRMAFGGVLLSRCENRASAYDHLQSLLRSVKIDSTRMRDLVFRVNWPLQSQAAPGVTINRLTTWSALQFSISQFALEAGGTGAVSPIAHPMFAVRLELDHNTDANRREPFTAEQVGKLYSELVGLASSNALDGEVI